MAKIKKSPAFPKPPLNNKVYINNSQRKIALCRESAKNVLLFLLQKMNLEHTELSLYFVGKHKIALLHAEFFDDPTPTDCITLPIDSWTSPKTHLLGEIFVCPKMALEYINMQGGELYEEITLYVVHGFLHLLGYNDETEEEKNQMRLQEKKFMEALAKNSLKITP